MTTITLCLEPAAAKVFAHYDNPQFTGQVKLREDFRKLIMMGLSNSVKSRPYSDFYPQLNVEIELQVPIEYRELGLNNKKDIYVTREYMKMINDLIIDWLQMEINVTVDIYLENGLTIENAISRVLNRYELDDKTEYKRTRALKANLRYRMKEEA